MKKFVWRKKQKEIMNRILPTGYKKMPKWKLALYCIFYILIAFVFITAIAFAWFAKDLPTPSRIANRHAAESTKIYDRTGQTLLYETGDQKRTIIKSDQISTYLKDATVSTEDAKFYSHHGYNSTAIISAVVDKVTGKTRRTRGASTITQQFVKNALLSSDRSITRKFKELILSVELEFMYNKDEILTMYLNEIPYGNSNAGAEAASKMYFGKTAKDLTLSEAATLAAIPQAPTYYSPYGTHSQELIKRKNYVLDRMVETGKVSKEEAEKAKSEDTTTLGGALKPRHDTMLAPHFGMYVLEQIVDQYGEEKIQKEGLKIITTLDYDKQKIAEQAVTDGAAKFEKYGASNAALVAVDPKTGQILAMVGSKDFFDTKIDGNVNVADSLRQPGSSFKPFAYATAFKKKEYSPSKILFDFQTDFGGGYVPQNYNGQFNGPITMRQALSNSLNIPAVKVLSLAGIDNVIRTAHDLGITSLNQRDRYGLSLVLGAGEVRPVEMAGAFGVFANGGVKHDLEPILKITDSKGKTIYDYEVNKAKERQVLDPQIAYEISSILSDNDARSMVFGTRSALFFPNRTVAAKTGTTSDFKDAWTVGFTPSISVAVWVGNSNAAKMSKGADGSVIAAPIFHQFIEKALAGTPSEDFKRPDGIQDVEVERWSNKLPNDQTTERTKDIFASWQVPTDQDDIHIKVRVCKGNGKLAPKGLPDSLTEERSFVNIHSERPDNPNWEDPVRNWAQGNGMFNSPPTEYCNPNEITPTISITSPANNSEVNAESNLTVSTSSSPKITTVEYFIDDISIGQGDPIGGNFLKKYDFSTLSSGPHIISAVGTDENGSTVKTSTAITVGTKSNPVTTNTISIKNLTVSVSSASAVITWTTDVPTTSQVSYGTNGSLTLESNTATALTTSHSVTLGQSPSTALAASTVYSYKVTSVDGSNNSGSSEVKTFTTTATPALP